MDMQIQSGKREKRSTMAKSFSKKDYVALAAFRYALRQFMHQREEAAQAAGITPQQHQALLVIMGTEGKDSISVGELAQQLLIRHHSAVGLVNRMESQGLVRRSTGKDRRFVFLSLTDHGLDVLEKMTVSHREEIKSMSTDLKELLSKI